jgi:hypothetical protein
MAFKELKGVTNLVNGGVKRRRLPNNSWGLIKQKVNHYDERMVYFVGWGEGSFKVREMFSK